MPLRPAMNCCDGARRHLRGLAGSDIGTLTTRPTASACRLPRCPQAADRNPPGAAHHKRRQLRAHGWFRGDVDGAGSKAAGTVRCDQPRALDLGAHKGRKVETVPAAVMAEVLARLAPLCAWRGSSRAP
jgi:hypothetical protein